jgi:hypothetical protein
MDKKETIYVSVCVAGKIISNYLLQISKSWIEIKRIRTKSHLSQ